MRTFLKIWIAIGLIAIGFGIGITVLAFTTNTRWREVPTFSMDESYDGVRNLDFDIGVGKVNVVEGDTFSVKAENVPENGFESYVTDGTWYIREHYDNVVDVFGLRFSFDGIFHWDEHISPRITITIPKDFIADSYQLKVGAGEVSAEAIYAAEGDISVDAGKLSIDKLAITDKSTYNVGTGEMEIRDFTSNDTKIECGIGSIVIDGTITGNNDISCGIGSIKLALTGSEEDYSYNIDAGIGSVDINGHHYHSIDRNISNDAENSLKLDCGIGSISVDFN